MAHLEQQTSSTDLVYQLEDKPPFTNSLVSAVTHLLAIFVPMITPALIVGNVLKLPVEMTAYLVSMAMVASGIGTFLQVNRFGVVGSGMLSIQSVNFSFVGVMISLGLSMKDKGLDENTMISTLLGVSFAGAFLVCGAAWGLPYLKRVITPTVSGVVVLLIGLSLIDVGITNFGGGFHLKGTPEFGSLKNVGLAAFVLAVVLIFNCIKKPLLRMSGVAIGLISGYVVALALGMVDFSVLQNTPIFTMPMPFKYGFHFDFSAFLVAGTIYLLSVFEAVGDLTATAMVSGQPYEGETFQQRLRGGVFADGLVSVVATALGSLPLTTFAQNNGVIQMTGVASRHVGKFIAVMLVVAGLFPIVGRLFTTIPNPVLGGAMVLMFGLIAIAGVRIIMTNGINRREAVIAATAVGVGLGVAFEPDVFKLLPEVFRNAIAAGGISAVVLNLILPRDVHDKSIYLSDKKD
ncbi:purine permease [Simonsiella muelleri]|uniref:Xanthine permease n=1 Tax=Simonsiella muelleri ATCC 29453 TaxID=641147 RepID=V9HM60_9NEIS|nr:nucleobase:cation symporter-2 family protein [Simonsiella muelleri]AUX60798.1 xanthine permease [Simonsiella muelleri ATCC 29453]EFG31628.1 xanthine permease [Simonsiella muelleri ATCC 29453]UBQ54377.1 purine permease [Simonsiella muelleri]